MDGPNKSSKLDRGILSVVDMFDCFCIVVKKVGVSGHAVNFACQISQQFNRFVVSLNVEKDSIHSDYFIC